MRSWTFFLAIPFTILFLGLGHDRSVRASVHASENEPVWRRDLRPLGYAAFMTPREPQAFYLRSEPICFSENDVLIASFLNRQKVGTLARRGQAINSLPLTLHGIFLDATTGMVRTTKEWSTAPPTAGIVASGKGRFLVLTPTFVESYSTDLHLLKRFEFSPDQQSRLWTFSVSPTGRSLLATYNNCRPHCDTFPSSGSGRRDISFQWLGAESLDPQPEWTDRQPWSISDTQVATLGGGYVKSRNVIIHEVRVRNRDGPWRIYCKVSVGYAEETTCAIPEFISNEVLAMTGAHTLCLLPAEGGAALLVQKFPEEEWISPTGLRASSDGRRLVVVVYIHKGGSALLDVDYHKVPRRIMVFDIPSRWWIYMLDAKKQNLKTISGIAMSPDGSLLGLIDHEGVLAVYKIPTAAR